MRYNCLPSLPNLVIKYCWSLETASVAFSSLCDGAPVVVDVICGVVNFLNCPCGSHSYKYSSPGHCWEVRGLYSLCLDINVWVFAFPSLSYLTKTRTIDSQTSYWLTVLPLVCDLFDLSPQQYRDNLSLWYHRPLQIIPLHVMSVSVILVYHMHWTVVRVA